MRRVTNLKFVLFSLFLLFCYSSILSQINQPRIKYFTLEDGLSQVSSNDLLLDQCGFVWIATQDGLNKFDGEKFEQFKYSKQDSLTLSGNLINKLLEDTSGKIWVGTISNGLNYYDPDLNIFHRVKLKNSLDNNEIISAIAEDNLNNIWVGSRISGLHKLKKTNKGSFEQTIYLAGIPIGSVLIDKENILWTGDLTGNIYAFDKLNILENDPTQIVKVQGNVQALYRIKNHLLIGSDYGFYLYDITKKQLKLIELSTENELPTKHVLDFLKNDDHSIWVGTGNGVYLFDWEQQKVLNKILYSEDKKNGLSNGTVQTLLKISSNQMLIGTANYLNLVDLEEPHFKNISKNLKGDHLLSDNVIFSIFKDNDDLWIGTSDGGLNLIRQGRAYHFIHNQNNRNGISGNVVRAIIKDEINQRLWLATTRGLNMIDLKTFNPNNPKFLVFHHNPENNNTINGDFIKDIVLDQNNNLWGATYGHGIFRLEFSNEKDYTFFRYKNDIDNRNSLKNDFTDCIKVDNENNIWVGTQSGLSKMNFSETDYEHFIFTNFSKIEGDESSLVHNSVYDILFDEQNRIWLGTRQGFSQYLGNGKFKSWTQQKQFSNDVVYSIQDDENDNLWMGTNDGLVRFDPKNNSFKQFGIADGIQSKEFDIHARFRDQEGVIYMGGIGGVTYYHPNDLEKIDKPQKLYFSELHIKGESLKVSNNANSILKQSLQKTDNLEFKHNQFPFFLQFSSIDYRLNKNVEYGYKLLPTDSDWTFLKEPEIQFLNLPSGNYTLQVNGFSRGAVWDQDPLTMNLTILPPWWLTWWAYAIYLITISSFSYYFYRFQLSRKLAVAESTRLKEVSNLKSSLYTNITHEFRTPLTVILGMTQNLKNNLKSTISVSDKNSLNIILRNGNSLLEMVNEMLDLAKIENGSMELNLIQIDVIPFIKYLSESFHSLAESKKINLTVYSEVEFLQMDLDVNKVASIISNLLSNAIKFTSANGKVIVHLNKTELDDSQFLVIKVQDNGLGLAEKDIAHLFDRFYQGNSTSTKQEGTGIGLSLTKEFVELMNGSITVTSTVSLGSTFVIQIPITNNSIKTENSKVTVLPSVKASIPILKEESLFEETDSKLPLVLLIEDNLDVAHYLETCLKSDYHTIHASDGNMGINMAFEKIPDIIISDVMMPIKDGYEVCATLKTDERTDHIPIILLTAKVTTKDRLTGLSHGADAYLVKPFIKEELFTRLNQLILIRKKLIGKLEKNGFASLIKNKIENPQTKFLKLIIKVIHENLDNTDFGLSQLAKEMHLSESQIYRKLKAITDKSTAVFIRSIRLQKAKELIETTNKTISEIAYEVGFNDPSWFSRAFKDEFGFSPSDINK
ncbi:two-component regulator propeller domain-containing protein [Maribacter sp. 1_MG-2023]|uniref:hybrid sensor histidine kinase/response regulator n=1 Tax=Maribacter sp. 1_MG-2023 TaxID=3062677 RepID=UPI0026E2001C|nr:two-component regulator propeller domain-containing protein [Maribacter sp. 1_MG-2023]MDO6472332.1 two-component regulator propeller domain-containing protein [Maribacter sp. 1_MG-2023]